MRSATPDVQGDTVAIQGMWLRTSCVQYAKKMGFRTVAIGFGPDKDILRPNWELTFTSTPKLRMREPRCRNWEAPT